MARQCLNPMWAKCFFFSSGGLLLATATAKLVSGSGNAHILDNQDPRLFISFRQLFLAVGTIEIMVAAVCFSGRTRLQTRLVAWLATNILIYRLGLYWIGYQPCHCLGNLTDALQVPPQTADLVMKIILAYLLLGSYATLFWLWRQPRRQGDG